MHNSYKKYLLSTYLCVSFSPLAFAMGTEDELKDQPPVATVQQPATSDVLATPASTAPATSWSFFDLFRAKPATAPTAPLEAAPTEVKVEAAPVPQEPEAVLLESYVAGVDASIVFAVPVKEKKSAFFGFFTTEETTVKKMVRKKNQPVDEPKNQEAETDVLPSVSAPYDITSTLEEKVQPALDTALDELLHKARDLTGSSSTSEEDNAQWIDLSPLFADAEVSSDISHSRADSFWEPTSSEEDATLRYFEIEPSHQSSDDEDLSLLLSDSRTSSTISHEGFSGSLSTSSEDSIVAEPTVPPKPPIMSYADAAKKALPKASGADAAKKALPKASGTEDVLTKSFNLAIEAQQEKNKRDIAQQEKAKRDKAKELQWYKKDSFPPLRSATQSSAPQSSEPPRIKTTWELAQEQKKQPLNRFSAKNRRS